jgi:hypothetical protein
MEDQSRLLPLDAPERAASFRSRGHVYRHVFRRLMQKDWDGFFAHIEAEIEQQGRDMIQMVNTDIASLWLYGAAIQRVEGYLVDDGRKIEDLPNWQERIPQNHRMIAIELVTRVSAAEPDEQVSLRADGEVVTLEGLWDTGSEGMTKYSGLKHFFDTPTAEHRRKLLRARSRSVIVGGSRKGTTRLASAQPMLAKLYDELIHSVEGYSAGGTALSGREAIVREMDGMHKVTAVGELFPIGARKDADETEIE